jgi:anti-sigma regulatory factor (Ser/Thr protein kinase)
MPEDTMPEDTMPATPSIGPARPLIAWSRDFPALPGQVREARRFLAGILEGCPAADDAALCLSELATNACLHSRSREPGGHFTVRVQRDDARLRVEVTDEGGPWALTAHADAQQPNGRGLLIVSQLATAWGRDGDAGTGWTAWFEFAGPPAPGPLRPPGCAAPGDGPGTLEHLREKP